MISLRYLVRAAHTWIGQQSGEPDETQFVIDFVKAYRIALLEQRQKRAK